MKNKTIMHIANYSAPYKGNFIASLEMLENFLDKNNNRMVYVFPKSCEDTTWAGEFCKNRGGVYFVKEPHLKYKILLDKELIQELDKVIKREQPDIIHTHFDGYDEYAVKANIKAKVIWHHHNYRTLMDNFFKRMYQKIMLYKQYAIVGKNVYIIAISDYSVNDIKAYGFNIDKIAVIPNGIQKERIVYKDRCINNTTKIFLNYGGRAYTKGLDILIKAVRLLKNKNLSFKILITDGVDTKDVIKKYFGEDVPKEIEIVNQTDNINELLGRCDYFISASRFETFSYAIAEAMLSGTPVISSNIKGTRWSYGQPSVISFETENAIDLANKMEKIINGKIKVTEESLNISRKYILDHYTTDVWSRQVIKFYEKLLN